MANFYLRTYIWIYIESISAKFWNLRTAASDYSFILVIYLFSAVSLQLWKSLWRVVRKRSVKIYRKTPEAATLPGPATLLKKSLSCQRHSCFLESLRSFEENFYLKPPVVASEIQYRYPNPRIVDVMTWMFEFC